MPSVAPLIDRIPSLYRPEPGDGTLLAALLETVAAELDSARDEATMVMPAHWVRHADRATFDPWFTRRRERASLPALAPTDLIDYADAHGFLIAVKDANTPLTEFLRESSGTVLQDELDAWEDLGAPPIALQRRGLDALTRIVRGPLIYDVDRFEDVALDSDTLARAEADPPGAERTIVNVQLLLEAFPTQLRRAVLDLSFVRDLGRLGALVPVVPWREPLSLRETVEAFRIRLQRMVALYRRGLGTIDALRGVVEATLPVDFTQPPELRDKPFGVEDFPPLAIRAVAAPTNGPPDNLVGPLMRWSLDNPGIAPAATALMITGLAPGGGIAATTDPMVELLQAGSARPHVAIGFGGTIAPDETLRLRTAYATWTIGAADLVRAGHLPTDEAFADPSEPGAGVAVAGAPADIVAVFGTSDGMLWAAAADGTALARFDGNAWTATANGLPEIRCFAEHGDFLLLGTADGLLRTPLFPQPGDDVTPALITGFDSVAVRRITPERAATERWIATDTGALRWNGSDAPQVVPLGGDVNVTTTVHAIDIDAGGAIHFGCDLGAFEYQPVRDTWYWYAGDAFSEQTPEWRAFAATPGGAPTDDSVFLPAVLDVRRGGDASLWFATTRGIARYVALEVDGGAYTTLLEAFPDICDGPVTRMLEDTRGGTWFCTERGLIRFDGRDWFQRRDDGWEHLGRADILPGIVASDRGGWRFERTNDRWQRFDTRGAGFQTPVTELRTSAEPAITAAIVTDHVVADMGSFDGATFTHASDVDPADIHLRIKPDDETIVDGGMPYIPRLPVGPSKWRYLSREPDDFVPPPIGDRPAWSTEGRLFPPPPSLDAPYSGRFDVDAPPDGHYDQAVFAYDPAARVTFVFEPRHPCAVLVRLYRGAGDPAFDPAVLDRIWEGIQLVRPAGVRALLAVDETIVRGS